MPFTRTTLAPKQTYTAQELADAAVVLARWLEEEPRCAVSARRVLDLRDEGPMIRWEGNGAEAGQWVQVSFLRKGPPKFPQGSLRLAAACANVAERQTFFLLLARSIRDVLQNGAPLVYCTHAKAEDQPQNKFVRALPTLVETLPLAFPNLFSVRAVDTPLEKRWEVKLA